MPEPTRKRLTLDLDPAVHLALKRLALESDVAMADILRSALAELVENDRLRARILKRARTTSPPAEAPKPEHP